MSKYPLQDARPRFPVDHAGWDDRTGRADQQRGRGEGDFGKGKADGKDDARLPEQQDRESLGQP